MLTVKVSVLNDVNTTDWWPLPGATPRRRLRDVLRKIDAGTRARSLASELCIGTQTVTGMESGGRPARHVVRTPGNEAKLQQSEKLPGIGRDCKSERIRRTSPDPMLLHFCLRQSLARPGLDG